MIASTAPVPVIIKHVTPEKHRVRIVRVHSGDTLSALAKRYYGKAARWPALYWANRDKVKDPSIIRTGERLSIAKYSPLSNWQHAKAIRKAMRDSSPARPVTVVVSAASAAPAAPVSESVPPSGGSFQQCVEERESGGDPSAVNASSGAGGLYQFLPSTWAGLGYSGLPQDAPVSEQNAAFQKLFAEDGTSPWGPEDGC